MVEMAEQVDRERGMPKTIEPPRTPAPSRDWGQEILRRRMLEDEADAANEERPEDYADYAENLR